ncbi:hypothetical protein EYF80_053943 [Liparis tanakae]|uniref:Uncharacterized protein n=1 Tax=Liparis tanakae TaxID=230148 RepID=A0A4Z2F485_9TELE|nr:hypothetical protein EYF80_053943 [Liparis tanakae]
MEEISVLTGPPEDPQTSPRNQSKKPLLVETGRPGAGLGGVVSRWSHLEVSPGSLTWRSDQLHPPAPPSSSILQLHPPAPSFSRFNLLPLSGAPPPGRCTSSTPPEEHIQAELEDEPHVLQPELLIEPQGVVLI